MSLNESPNPGGSRKGKHLNGKNTPYEAGSNQSCVSVANCPAVCFLVFTLFFVIETQLINTSYKSAIRSNKNLIVLVCTYFTNNEIGMLLACRASYFFSHILSTLKFEKSGYQIFGVRFL